MGGEHAPSSVLEELASHAARALPSGHNLLCGVNLVRKKLPATVATSAPQARAVDELQYSFGDEPCLTALRDEVLVYVPNLDQETRWPENCAAAWLDGIESILSVPLPLDGSAGAAMNLFAADKKAFTDDDIASAHSYAVQAAKSLRLAVRMAQLVSSHENLKAALKSNTEPGVWTMSTLSFFASDALMRLTESQL